eukprot:CAMPEP_0182522372 /NCGR_PEP_ID=MMETSP1323-20130603/238_1 /TAXON_ID=236787 /ORGANISM="Florenciella parvula, Strain RCC1693" /LENGTH=225 /DNA_ID=CAMNT_0024730479 /DNA_START=68 /DNA_END=745 /DNA_ORIENTATION=-
MMRTIVLALCAASATAFAPSARSATRGMVSMGAKSAAIPFLPQPAGCDGTLVGDVGFDPLGLSSIDPKSLPQIIPEAAVQSAAEPLPTMYWMREAELKHGRLCMLAIVGCITVDSGIHFPGAKYEGLSSIAAHDAMVDSGNMGFLFTMVGIIELISGTGIAAAQAGSDREPGDFALDPLKFCADPELKAKYKLAEITHARLAMIAFSGLITQAVGVSDQFPYVGF